MNTLNKGDGNITWLASYPKSGNTWLRIFLSRVLTPSTAHFNINHLVVKGIASSRALFDDYTGLDSSDLVPNEIDRIRPDLYVYISDFLPEYHYCKTHDAYRNTTDNQPLFPKQASKRVVYIIRNPLDIAVSYKYHLSSNNISQTANRVCDSNGGLALAKHKLPNQLPQYMGSWSAHVSSWVNQKHIPVTVVRYEDMLFNGIHTFGQLLQTLNIDITSTELAAAIEATRFGPLQQQENTLGFNGKPQLMPQFFRNGQAGSWRKELNQQAADKIIACNRSVMQQFGYLDAHDKPVF